MQLYRIVGGSDPRVACSLKGAGDGREKYLLLAGLPKLSVVLLVRPMVLDDLDGVRPQENLLVVKLFREGMAQIVRADLIVTKNTGHR